MAELLSNVELGRSSKTVINIDPSVLISIMEAQYRVNKDEAVFGILVGDDMPSEIIVQSCFFSSPLKKTAGSVNLDVEYLKQMSEHMKKLNSKKANLGFFYVGKSIDKTVVEIYGLLASKMRLSARVNDSVILLVDPEIQAVPKLTGFVNVRTNSRLYALFQEVKVEIVPETTQLNQKVSSSVYTYDKLPENQKCLGYDYVVDTLSDVIGNLSRIIELIEQSQKQNQKQNVNILRAIFRVTEIGNALSTYSKAKIQEMIEAYTQDILMLSYFAKLAKVNTSISYKLTEQLKSDP